MATGYVASFWLLAFSGFLFFGLAVVKRVAELIALPEQTDRLVAGRGYRRDDLPILQIMGVSASFMSSLVLALFVQSDTVAQNYTSPGVLWMIIPFILFWQCRMWLITMRGGMHHDPIVFAARDRVAWATGAGVLCAMLAARLPA